MIYLPSITVLLIFACLVAYEYIRDLRRDRDRARADALTAWRLYDAATKGVLAPDPYSPQDQRPTGSPKDAEAAPFVPTGIGPTAIADRELRREIAERKARTEEPPFASAATLNPELARHPTTEAIRAAAREATRNNGGQN